MSFGRSLPAAALQSTIHWPQMKEGSMLEKLVKFGWLLSLQVQTKVRLSWSGRALAGLYGMGEGCGGTYGIAVVMACRSTAR